MDYVTNDDLREALKPFPRREEVRSLIREEIQSVLAPYATREEVRELIRDEIQGALVPYPTRDEMRDAIREEGERTRRHFDAVTESNRGDTQILAEAYAALNQKVDTGQSALDAKIAALAKRVTRLEVSRE